LQIEDLIDFYLPRDRKILPLNKIKEAILLSTDDSDHHLVKDKFKGVGSVDTILLLTPNDFEKLAQYYLIGTSLTTIMTEAIMLMDLLTFV
jgi:hypothetical protein